MVEAKVDGSGKKYIVSIVIFAVLACLSIVFYCVSLIGLVVFLIALIVFLGLLGLSIIAYVKFRKRRIERLKKISAVKVAPTEEDLIRLYNLAGIPVIRDENGKIKNIYELLVMEVKYGADGNRIRTIYELLGIVPRFDKNGKEIPTFLSIKNRVNGFVKPKQSTSTLTRVLTDKEKEELLLKQMLEEKLKESQEKGDDKKAKAIQKVIAAKKKEEPKPSKKPILKLAGAVKSSSDPKIGSTKGGKNYNIFEDIVKLAGIRAFVPPVVHPKPTPETSRSPEVVGFVIEKTSPESDKAGSIGSNLYSFKAKSDVASGLYVSKGSTSSKLSSDLTSGSERV